MAMLLQEKVLSFDQIISSLGFAIANTEGLHGKADDSSVGAQRRQFLLPKLILVLLKKLMMLFNYVESSK